MVKFRQLFSFSQKEIDEAFKAASFRHAIPGLKLLSTPTKLDHGKLLIIISRAAGKAHIRNKIRRQIKAIFYEQRLYKKPRVWILVVYKEATQMPLKTLKEFMLETMS